MRVYINNFNLLTWPKAMAEKLAAEGHDVTFVDNASTYEPLLEFYETCPYRVHKIGRNLGHVAPWQVFAYEMMGNDWYAVTDPDLDLSGVPADWAEVMVEGAKFYSKKCGLSLDDTGIPTTNPAWEDDRFCDFPDGGHPISWGKVLPYQHRNVRFYDRQTDTTFAVYAPRVISPTLESIRVGRPYTARHMPWHVVMEPTGDPRAHEYLFDDELRYYMERASLNSTTTQRFKAHSLFPLRERKESVS